jgi:Cytosol aminopeptidase family, N-terminal domain
MQVTLLPVDLARWDQTSPADAICVLVWSDVRPVRGAAGLLDWRMCGRLSTLIAAGQVTGAEGEQTLFPTAHRLPWRMVLTLGAGARGDFTDKRLAAGVGRALAALRGLRVRRVALALPGRDGERAGTAFGVSPRRALDLTLHEVDAHPGIVDELTVITAAAAQKELTDALRLRAIRPEPRAGRKA